MDEFARIHRYFAPLAAPEGLGLLDDAAVVTPRAGYQLVVTSDAIVEGVHFPAAVGSRKDDAVRPEQIAQKLLRVNLSDMAAMGAKPLYYTMAGVLPAHIDERWVASFAEGLAQDQEAFGVQLIGGDSVTQETGAATLILTLLGEVKKGKALQRTGTQPGDVVCVTGSIGDAALGLEVHQGNVMSLTQSIREYLLSRYHIPQPRVDIGMALTDVATAAVDISDGLVADLGHIAACSGVNAVIYQEKIPLSEAARTLVEHDAALWEAILTGGDDYELCFAAPEARLEAVMEIAKAQDVAITPIGQIEKGTGVQVLDAENAPLYLERTGYVHG